jgi:predicted nucleic acid-binding protein
VNPILIDSSVWIEYFRRGDTPHAQDLDLLIKSNAVCFTAIVRAELLSGARTEKEFHLLENQLSAVRMLPEFSELWDECARARFRLARRGLQVSLMDLSIALLSMHYRCPLFTGDRDFKPIASVVPIKFYRPLRRS